MGFGIDRRARSPKAKTGLRALIGKAPDAQKVGDRLVRITKRMLKGAVTDASPKRVTLELHPAAAPVRILVLPDGDLEILAETGSIGPAYHDHVIATITPILDELDFVWDGEAEDARAATATWLATELRSGATRIAMPAELDFKLEAAVLTPMGPRDRAWVDAVLADPLRGADAFAWWDAAPGHQQRSCALLAMWLEVPWREPVEPEERTLMERVDRDLRAARKASKTIALPWAEWAELLANLGEDDHRIADVRARARGAPPTIGYRRHPMNVELSGGWSIELPGSFVGAWEDDGARYWSTDGDRVIEFTSLTANGEQDSQKLLEIAPEKHPVVERIVEDHRRGRAETYDDGKVRIVHGLMAAAPEVAILTVKGPPASEGWALATWRSLRNR